jgi:hypothetical protein
VLESSAAAGGADIEADTGVLALECDAAALDAIDAAVVVPDDAGAIVGTMGDAAAGRGTSGEPEAAAIEAAAAVIDGVADSDDRAATSAVGVGAPVVDTAASGAAVDPEADASECEPCVAPMMPAVADGVAGASFDTEAAACDREPAAAFVALKDVGADAGPAVAASGATCDAGATGCSPDPGADADVASTNAEGVTAECAAFPATDRSTGEVDETDDGMPAEFDTIGAAVSG